MKKICNIINNKYFIFTISFLVMFLYLLSYEDLVSSSGDAVETWKVIKTFFHNEKYISYVMYKGFYAFLPGVICYQLSNLINVDSYLFLKIFHAISFAYIVSLGMPNVIKNITNKEVKGWQEYLFILIMLLLEYNLFIFISVDFMSLALLLLCINSLIRIKKSQNIKWYQVLISGLLLGICTCLSGQFLPSALVLIIYGFYLVYKKSKKLNKKKLLLVFIIFISSIFLTKGIDKIYVNKVVIPARESGAWLPNGGEWLQTGFTANMQMINYPYSLKDNLGEIIMEKEDINRDIIAAGGAVYDYKGMVKTVLKYPFIFIARWTERLLLGLINDPFNYYPGNRLFSPLLMIFVMSSVVFIFLKTLKDKIKKVKDLFNFETLIVVSFILSALVPSIGHVENRYYFAIRTLMLGMVFLSPFIPNAFKSIKEFFKKYNFKNIKNYKINYNVVVYIIFVIVYTILYMAIYQSSNTITGITYSLFN